MNAARSRISKKYLSTLLQIIPGAAARLVARIEGVAARIDEAPYIGQATRNPKFRRLPVGDYLIVYEVGTAEVVIHYIRHGARRRPWEGEG
jgi:plasmid stabilization system protein ParE